MPSSAACRASSAGSRSNPRHRPGTDARGRGGTRRPRRPRRARRGDLRGERVLHGNAADHEAAAVDVEQRGTAACGGLTRRRVHAHRHGRVGPRDLAIIDVDSRGVDVGVQRCDQCLDPRSGLLHVVQSPAGSSRHQGASSGSNAYVMRSSAHLGGTACPVTVCTPPHLWWTSSPPAEAQSPGSSDAGRLSVPPSC